MPSKGLFDFVYSKIILRKLYFSNCLIALPNAPTPGKITCEELRIVFSSSAHHNYHPKYDHFTKIFSYRKIRINEWSREAVLI